MSVDLTLPLALACAAAVSLGLIYGIHVLSAFVKNKTHNQAVGYVMSVVETLATKVVAETYQAYVAPLKTAGTFDANSQKVAMSSALTALKSYLGPDGLSKVAGILGAGANTEDFLKTFLESAVLDSKPVIAAAAPTPPDAAPLPGVVLAPASNPN